MELSWTWPGLVVIALIVAACFQGYQKGLIKELVSALFYDFFNSYSLGDKSLCQYFYQGVYPCI